MRKTTMLSLFLLCAVWAFAQTSPSSSSSSQNPSSATSQSSSGNVTVEGCLNGSSGNYTLTDTSGKTWQLTGDTSKLSEHVGHKIQVTGSTAAASPSSTGASGAAGASSSGQTLNMSSMKHISTTCTPGQ